MNEGLLGTPTGTAMNSVGLIYHGAMTEGASAAQQSPQHLAIVCMQGKVQWSSEGSCFTPTQFHINVLAFSLLFNLVLLVIIAVTFLSRKAAPK